jgi:hypothetical protein
MTPLRAAIIARPRTAPTASPGSALPGPDFRHRAPLTETYREGIASECGRTRDDESGKLETGRGRREQIDRFL